VQSVISGVRNFRAQFLRQSTLRVTIPQIAVLDTLIQQIGILHVETTIRYTTIYGYSTKGYTINGF
jgi:hypothetical protein